MYKHVKGVVEVVVEEFEETSANHLSQYRLGVEGHAAWRENYMQEAMTMLAGYVFIMNIIVKNIFCSHCRLESEKLWNYLYQAYMRIS